MKFFKKTIPVKHIALREAIFVIAGICLFALFVHRDPFLQIISFISLILAAIIITRSIHDRSSLLLVFGIIPLSKKVISYTLAGMIFGSMLGVVNNYFFIDSLLPSTLTKFAITAPLIGITEELVFRGYVQTKAASIGVWFSIIFASFGHTLYKYLVIKSMPVNLAIDFQKLIVITFAAGIVFGILRQYSKNVTPPAIAHAAFDIIVYGGAVVAPVWIWG